MWKQYRKTCVGMQLTIALVTICVFVFFEHSWIRAATFFAVMQISAVIGAVWAVRIKALAARARG